MGVAAEQRQMIADRELDLDPRLRPAETGLTMVRGKIGGDGRAFNLLGRWPLKTAADGLLDNAYSKHLTLQFEVLDANKRPVDGAVVSIIIESPITTVKAIRSLFGVTDRYGKLSLDPDYVRAFFHSKMDKRRGWNMSGFHDPRFDRLAAAADAYVQTVIRRDIVESIPHEMMQDILDYHSGVVEAAQTEKFLHASLRQVLPMIF